MTNEQKVEILEREIKRLTEENNALREQNEKFTKMTKEGTFQFVQRYVDGYNEILARLKQEERKYNKLNRALLHAKNNYLLDMEKFQFLNKMKYK